MSTNKNQAIYMYLLFGVLTTVINIIAYYLCYEIFGITNIHSTVISWLISVIFAFITNKRYVFTGTKCDVQTITSEFIRFCACRIATGFVEVAIMYIFVDLLLYSGMMMKIIANIAVVILNYTVSKFIIFKNK